MVDSVHIRLQLTQLKEKQITQLYNLIHIHKQSKNEYDHITTQGTYKNFQIAINHKSVTINGSLPKYVYGNNVQSIPFSLIGSVIKKLSVETGLPLLKGELQRVDVAECFVVSRDVRRYFSYLEDTPDYTRNRDDSKLGNGVRYLKDTVVLAFYDKTHEAIEVPAFGFKPSIEQVIRIEMRIQKNVRRTVFNKAKKFGVVYLLSDTFHKILANQWHIHYSSIIKRRYICEHGEIKNIKDFNKYLLTSCIYEHGLIQTLDKLEVIAKENKWTTVAKSKARGRILQHYNCIATSIPNKYIEELDKLVKNGKISQYLLENNIHI